MYCSTIAAIELLCCFMFV